MLFYPMLPRLGEFGALGASGENKNVISRPEVPANETSHN
jgi:hypothetical protein